jgi:hypothetical protein
VVQTQIARIDLDDRRVPSFAFKKKVSK